MFINKKLKFRNYSFKYHLITYLMDQYTLIDIVEFTSPENCKKIVDVLEIFMYFEYFERSIRIETMIKYGWDENTCKRAAVDGN